MQKSPVALIFIHGAGLSSYIWHRMPTLANTTSYHFNLLGRGKADTSQKSFQEYEDDLLAQMKHVKEEKIVVIAHSLGGIFMMRLLAAFSERVIGIVAMSATVPKSGHNFFSCLPFPQRFIMPVVVKIAGTKVPEPAIRAGLCTDLAEKDVSVIVRTFTTESKAIYQNAIQYPQPSIPACYLIFTEDLEYPKSHQRKIAERLAAQVIEIPGGHLAMLSQSERVSSAVSSFVLHVTINQL